MTVTDLKTLGEYFCDYRAEWSASLFGELFIAPPYFSKLETGRPCFLIGGRGTGKTTALRSLRFDASDARLKSENISVKELSYFGLYIRINKNRVRAFQGPPLRDDEWAKVFAHYFNILCCLELCRLSDWLRQRAVVSEVDLKLTAAAFGFATPSDPAALAVALNEALVALEVYVNNPTRVERPIVSAPEAPVRLFVEALRRTPKLSSQLIFCCQTHSRVF
jgi:hypothetical protein